MKFEPVEGVARVVLQGQPTGQLASPFLPPTDLPQLGSSQHQRCLLGEVEERAQV